MGELLCLAQNQPILKSVIAGELQVTYIKLNLQIQSKNIHFIEYLQNQTVILEVPSIKFNNCVILVFELQQYNRQQQNQLLQLFAQTQLSTNNVISILSVTNDKVKWLCYRNNKNKQTTQLTEYILQLVSQLRLVQQQYPDFCVLLSAGDLQGVTLGQIDIHLGISGQPLNQINSVNLNYPGKIVLSNQLYQKLVKWNKQSNNTKLTTQFVEKGKYVLICNESQEAVSLYNDGE
ncbi:Hypothetical_protein [Hexamita inflata]|uniref:Hypothetical_protein n=1 Tax=Hexamita inflata TaxID=28002 RepID=A0AA86R5K0_9EUKA|nr:Hypothetical protein HINF_LOCUS58625 [Hexamita inflata]